MSCQTLQSSVSWGWRRESRVERALLDHRFLRARSRLKNISDEAYPYVICTTNPQLAYGCCALVLSSTNSILSKERKGE